MARFTIDYYVNVDFRDKGYEPARHLALAVEGFEVEAPDREAAAEVAFAALQRVDGGTPGEAALDAAKAPSMSVGDVVVVTNVEYENGYRGPTMYEVGRVGFKSVADRWHLMEVVDARSGGQSIVSRFAIRGGRIHDYETEGVRRG
jgi:hypothetical protein